MRVLVADDHDLVLTGLSLVFGKLGPEVGILECGDFAQAYALAEQNPDIDLAVLDLNMPGMDHLVGLEAFRARFPDVPTVVMSGYYQHQDVMDALRLGAAGFLPKTLGSTAMLNAFRLVLSGERFLPADLLTEQPAAASGLGGATAGDTRVGDRVGPALTKREREVLQGVIGGLTNKAVGRTLDIQEVTVKLHLRNVYQKLGAKNRVQAVKIALDAGIVE